MENHTWRLARIDGQPTLLLTVKQRGDEEDCFALAISEEVYTALSK